MTEPAIFPAGLQQRVSDCGVIAVLVIEDAYAAVPLARALLEGGIAVMELTLRTDAALDAVRAIRREVPEMLVGCGTVLTPGQVDAAAGAGAAFAVSPGLNPAVVRHARDRGLPFAPGIATPSDIEGALSLGCRLLKFFPAETSGGLAHLKVMSAPFRHLGVRYIPLGGLNAGNAASYLAETSLVAAVGGSWLAPPERVATGDWEGIRKLAGEAREIARRARIDG